MEPRRTSITSPRKRLFSASSARRSTSSHGPTSPSDGDDKRSIFSFESDIRPATSSGVETITMSFGAAGGPLSLMTKNACISPSSFWDEQQSPAGSAQGDASKRASQTDYTPQYIMAPAEQLKLAEKLEDQKAAAAMRESEADSVDAASPSWKPKLDLHPGDFGMTFTGAPTAVRSRTDSAHSHQPTPTGEKSNGGVSRAASASPSTKLPAGAQRLSPTAKLTATEFLLNGNGSGPARSSSLLAKGSHKAPSSSMRPSTAQASLTMSSPSTSTYPESHSPNIPNASLPPPPRRRPSRSDLNEVESPASSKRTSVVPIIPLSPPPMRAARVRQDSASNNSLVSRPPSSFDRQKIMKRRSLMKKPSFLDIDDDADAPGAGSDSDPPESPMDGSFLDMERGKNSFDTIRSVDSSYFV